MALKPITALLSANILHIIFLISEQIVSRPRLS